MIIQYEAVGFPARMKTSADADGLAERRSAARAGMLTAIFFPD